MNGSNRHERCRIDRVENGMNAFQKMANTLDTFFFRKGHGPAIQLAQVRTSGKNGLTRAPNNADGSLRREHIKCGNKFFQFREHDRANFIGRFMLERQFDDSCAPFPAQRLADEIFHFHACCLLTASRLPFESYMALISDAYRALMASRRSLPLAVSNPFSGVKTSRTIMKLRTCR